MSEETREARRAGREARLDAAIDGAVREMLDVEPRADLRARVIARLTAPAPSAAAPRFGRPRIGWVVVPLMAAALVLLVFVARRSEPPSNAPVARERGARLPETSSAPAPIASMRPRESTPNSGAAPTTIGRSAPSPARMVAAAAVEDVDLGALAPLPAPQSISVARLEPPGEAVLPPIGPQPITVRALEISALPPEAPQDGARSR